MPLSSSHVSACQSPPLDLLNLNRRPPASEVDEPTSPDVIRILVADDHVLFRNSLRVLLDARPDFHVIGETGDDATILRMAREQGPDILLLNWEMSRRNGMKILRELAASGLSACILLIAVTSDTADVARAIQLGVKGILSSETTEESLCEAIHKVLKGQYILGQAAVSSLVATATGPRPTTAFQSAKRKFGITRREFDVISEVVAGYSTAEISARLSLSSNTLKHHMSHIFDKLGVSNRLELVLFSVHHIVRDVL